MLTFEGDRQFVVPPADLGAKLADARFLVTCVPGVENVRKVEPGEATFSVRPGFSFFPGTLDVTAKVLEATPGQSVRLSLYSKGIGSSSTVEVTLTLQPDGAGTRAHYVAVVKEMTGLLKAAPGGLIQAAARKTIEDVWTQVNLKLTAS